MRKSSAPISLAGSRLGQPRHVCAFFTSAEEEYRVLLPFIKDGFECGDKAIHVVSPDQHRDHLQRLAGIGIDSTSVQRSGQFELRSSTEPTFKTVGSIRIACCSRLSRWQAAMPREDFP